MFSPLYSYVHGAKLRAKKSWQNVQSGTAIAFDPLTIDDNAQSKDSTTRDLPASMGPAGCTET
jgi:hypothetical protein